MWSWSRIAGAVFGVCALFLAAYTVFSALKIEQDIKLIRCQAAQQTILDEAELIAAGGKFPGEQVTDRWKKLLVGCDAL